MTIGELFKYNVLFSNTIFLAVFFVMVRSGTEYSYKKHTISKSIYFLKSKNARLVFQLNFFVKAILDLGFWWFLVAREVISILSVPSALMLVTIAFFGLLGYYTEEKDHKKHRFLISWVIVFWTILEVALAVMTKNLIFVVFTILIATTLFCIAFWFLNRNRVTVYIQLFCVVTVYLWLLLYIYYFL